MSLEIRPISEQDSQVKIWVKIKNNSATTNTTLEHNQPTLHSYKKIKFLVEIVMSFFLEVINFLGALLLCNNRQSFTIENWIGLEYISIRYFYNSSDVSMI